MDIKQFRLHNVGRFKTLDIPLAPTKNISSNITVLVGNNGAGKTTLLHALTLALSWFVARLRSEKGNGSPIAETSILNETNTAMIGIDVMDNDVSYSWQLAKARRGRSKQHNSQLSQVTKLAEYYRQALSDNEHGVLPLIAFYPVERAVLDIPLKIRTKHRFLQLDGYDNSLSQGIDFRRFFEWFREREDIENEMRNAEFEDLISNHNNDMSQLLQQAESLRDHQLTAVRTAISRFMPEFSHLKVRRKPRLHMSVDKDGQTLNVAQLSQGEKSLMALVGDIARRLAMMNPLLKNPLQGDGIVLIDEVDMHLHPRWQRSIVARLTQTFPNCQFLLTTHSPLVISDCKDVLVYSLDDGELTQIPSQYGQDANSVLLDVMDTHIRNAVINEKINTLLDKIYDKQLDDAKSLLDELEQELPDNNLELVKAKLLLRKQELRVAKD